MSASRGRLTVIVLVDDHGALAKEGEQILFIPEDLERFRKRTTGHAMIMGRKTFDAMGLLPNRHHIVLSRRPGEDGERLQYVSTPEEAVEAAGVFPGETFVIGGGQIIHLLWDAVDRLILTHVHTETPGADVFLPPYREDFTLVREIPIPHENYQVVEEHWQRKSSK
ncbi:MAG: dihydrofolate reductase [Tissierellia bacterium]|nr:dihydrofolate reductase [Tissierellia bacterium]